MTQFIANDDSLIVLRIGDKLYCYNIWHRKAQFEITSTFQSNFDRWNNPLVKRESFELVDFLLHPQKEKREIGYIWDSVEELVRTIQIFIDLANGKDVPEFEGKEWSDHDLMAFTLHGRMMHP